MNSNSKRITLGVTALLAVTIVAWIIRGTNARVGDVVQGEARDTADLEPRPAAGFDAPSKSGVATATARVDASHASDAADVQDESTAVTIEIVRGDTLAPCPGAEVMWWPARLLDGVPGGFESWLQRSEVEEHVSDAVVVRADDHGIAKLYGAVQGGTVTAAADGAWGRATIESGRKDPLTLVLAADVDLIVHVVDTRGAPVSDATVVLRQLGHSAHTDHLSARTHEDGIAVLCHADLWWSWESSSVSGHVVAVPGLLDPPCEHALDRETRASGTIELVLETSGFCVVEFVDALGRNVAESFDARLCFADGGKSNAAETACETIASRPNDAVVFEHVEFGRELSVEVTRAGVPGSLSARGHGPKGAGERVLFRVQLEADHTFNVAGRIVDQSGAPLGGLALSAQLETTDGKRQGDEAWSTRTNKDGQFMLELRAPPASSDEVLLALSAQKGTESSRGRARRALPRDLSPGSYDLGDIKLEDAPLVVAGQVVDTEGHPVAEAVITAVAPMSSGEAGPGREADSFPISGRSDTEGRFTLRGIATSDDVIVRAHKVGYFDRALTASRGNTSLQLVLGPAGTITGKVLLDPSLRSSPVLVEATLERTPVADDLGPSVEPVWLASNGGFEVRDLCAGAYSLRVVYAATGCELGRLDHVIVECGRANIDERINPLDLSATHRLIELQLVDDRGAPVHGGSCASRAGDDPAATAIVTRESAGRLPLLYAGHPLAVSVSAKGFLCVELERVNESRRVTLLASANLRLELARGLPALPPELRLGARLTPVDARWSSLTSAARTNSFDNRGILVCELPFAGEVKVDLFLSGTDAQSPRVEHLKSCAPRTVRLAPHSMVQAFQIEFDPSDLARALEAIRSER